MDAARTLSDTDRNRNWASLDTRWDRRTRLAAAWLEGETSVADIGCGLMTLEDLLPQTTKYVPMDLVYRDTRTIVFDLNKDPIPRVNCDAAALLGVLEYIDDLGPVFEQIRQFPKAVMSYNHVSLNDVFWAIGLRHKRVTWKNRHTKAALRRLLKASGLRIVRERMIRVGETLYEVRPRP